MLERNPEFDRQIQEMWRPLISFAMKLCRDRIMAEDMVQSTIIKALENHESFKEGTNLRGWLFTIMRNDYFSVMRKRRREVEDTDGVFSLRLSVPENQSSVVDLRIVQTRMKRLPVHLRRCIYLVGVLGLDYETASETLNVAVGTIKSRAHRARAFLETGMDEEELEVAVPAPLVSDVDRIRELYQAGKSVSEISQEMDGMKKTKIMAILASKNIRR